MKKHITTCAIVFAFLQVAFAQRQDEVSGYYSSFLSATGSMARCEALDALGKTDISPTDAGALALREEMLSAALTNDDQMVVTAAVSIIGKLTLKLFDEPLAKVYRSAPNRFGSYGMTVQIAITSAFGSMAGPEGKAILMEVLESKGLKLNMLSATLTAARATGDPAFIPPVKTVRTRLESELAQTNNDSRNMFIRDELSALIKLAQSIETNDTVSSGGQ